MTLNAFVVITFSLLSAVCWIQHRSIHVTYLLATSYTVSQNMTTRNGLSAEKTQKDFLEVYSLFIFN